MKAHCLPFRQIPHTSRLFLDYLDFTPTVQQFYSRGPRFLSWAADDVKRIQYPAERRATVAKILERQNKAWGASAASMDNIARFRDGACALVTGQQVGLFGGPAFSVYKALSAIKLAGEAKKLGIDCVPIFWLATEDHDLGEINQVQIPGPEGRLEKFSSTTRGKTDAPVATVSFGPEISELADLAAALLGEPEATALLREAYHPGESFGTAFAKLFAKLFGELGVILLDGSDPELDSIAAPLYAATIEQSAELNQLLLRRDEELQAAGYHQQVRITDTSTPLFMIRDGQRIPVHAESRDQFAVGDEKISSDQLLELARSTPEVFSPNVLLRPVVQDFLLPTLAYVGGSAEVAYFAQAAVLYEALLARTTPILSRFSATLIEPKIQALLEKYRLSFTDVLRGPEELREKMGSHLLPPNLQASFDQATAAVERTMSAVEESLAQLDKTLVESAKNAQSKMLYQITNLRARAARAELRQSDTIGRHAELLSTFLYPEKALQEREIGGVYFLAKHGRELLDGLLSVIHPDCLDHQVITFG